MEKLEFEVRFEADPTNASPGRLTGVLMHYGQTARDRPERFAQDAFHWRQEGIVINEQHNRQSPIVRAVPFLIGSELKIDVPLPPTQRGRDAAIGLQGENPLYTGLSVEFKAEQQGYVEGVREIRRALLGAAALVDAGSYLGSTVEVRAEANAFRPWSVFVWL